MVREEKKKMLNEIKKKMKKERERYKSMRDRH